MDLHPKAADHYGDMGQHQGSPQARRMDMKGSSMETSGEGNHMDMAGGSHHMDMPGMGNMMHMDMSMMMSHYFTVKSDSPFLLKWISLATPEGILCAMAFTIFLTVVFELMNIKGQQLYSRVRKYRTIQSRRGRVCNLVLLTMWKMSSVCVGYVMMLCVMTYNVWLLVAVLLGSGVGYWVLRPILASHDGHEGPIQTQAAETELLHDYTSDQVDAANSNRNGDPANGSAASKLLTDEMAVA